MIDDIIKADDVSNREDVFIDEPTKLNQADFVDKNQMDVGKIVAELDEIEVNHLASASGWDNFLNWRIPLNFTSSRALVLALGIFASFAGMLSGLDQSIISGAKYGIGDALHPDSNESSLIDSLMPLGAMAGSIMMTPLNHFLGRRMSIVVSCLWYTLGGGICAGARSVSMLYAGRFILGIGVGIEGGCVGIYISESVPPSVRGSLVSMYQFMIAFGEVVGYACCGVFFEVHGGWRFMLGSTLVFSTILFCGVFLLPESPRWLMSKGKEGRAWNVWKSLRNVEEEESLLEFLQMRQTLHAEEEQVKNEKVWERYLELFIVPRDRRAFVYAMMMIMLGQMTGINAVLYNMGQLVAAMSFEARESVLMSMVGGGALMIGTIPALLWMDKFGRRVWAQNIVIFFIGLVLVGAGYTIDIENDRAAALGVYFAGMILYMGFFGTYSCLTWVVPAESFSLRTRAQGMSICSASLYLWSFIVTYNFDRMQKRMTYPGLTIGFYGGIAVVGFFYQLFFMPETKDRTLEEIDDIFSMKTRSLVKLNIKSTINGLNWLRGRRPTSSVAQTSEKYTHSSSRKSSDFSASV